MQFCPGWVSHPSLLPCRLLSVSWAISRLISPMDWATLLCQRTVVAEPWVRLVYTHPLPARSCSEHPSQLGWHLSCQRLIPLSVHGTGLCSILLKASGFLSMDKKHPEQLGLAFPGQGRATR